MPGRVTGEPSEGTNRSRESYGGNENYGGTSSHVTVWSNDGQGNSERTSCDLTPSPSGGWDVSDTHTTKQ